MKSISATMSGIYRDRLIGPDKRLLHDSGWVSNTIVTNCRVLLAGFMKNDFPNGIQFMAVGQGDEAWDSTGPPAADESDTDLVNRFAPEIEVSALQIDFLNETDQPTVTPTNRLQITATLSPGYPAPIAPLNTYPLREFGLFGRAGGADYMINYIRHPAIHKDAAATLIRVVRLFF